MINSLFVVRPSKNSAMPLGEPLHQVNYFMTYIN